MRKLNLVTWSGLAVVAAVTIVILWRGLSAERAMNVELRAAAKAPSAPRPLIAPPPTVAPEGEVRMPQAQAAKLAAAVAPTQVLEHFGPSVAKSSIRAGMAKSYPGLSEALGLSPEEVEKMWDLLAANQLNAMGAVPIMNGRVDTDAIRESSLSRIEAQRTLNESVASLLGPDRMDRWKEYQETLPSRQQTVQLGRILQSSGQALSDQQAAALADTIIAEQMGLRDGLARGGGGSMDPGQAQEERFRLQAESNRRIVEGASSYLNTNQVAALRAALDERLGRSRSAISTLQRSMSEPPQQPANAFH